MNSPRQIITLTTDFGMRDGYVAQMKGVILSINPEATIVDVSHDVGPQAIEEALYIAQTAWQPFPAGAIHVCVVDPGVGTARRPLAIETARGFFVGPDNGVLSAALEDEARDSVASRGRPAPNPLAPFPEGKGERGPRLLRLPDGVRGFEITNRRFMREPVSVTFHGRDVFAPAAAHLSLGVQASELGRAVEEMLAYPPLRARRDEGGTLRARVIHIDRFGNVITDARAEDLPEGGFVARAYGRDIGGPAKTYAEARGIAAIAGSSGYLEITMPNGSAAIDLRARLGDEVEIAAQ